MFCLAFPKFLVNFLFHMSGSSKQQLDFFVLNKTSTGKMNWPQELEESNKKRNFIFLCHKPIFKPFYHKPIRQYSIIHKLVRDFETATNVARWFD